MKTIMQTINPESFRDEELEEACRILQKGGLVAFPTETVYGLGGDAMHPEASAKIYAAKGRPSDNPLIVHIADMDALEDIAQSVPEAAVKLADHFWPGPLTMIFPKKEAVPKSTTGGLETVAVRMPSHPVARALIRESGVYIAAPSANTSGRPSPTKAEHVKEDLDGRIDMILDGGAVGIGLESTIVDLSTGVPTILRPGYITGEMLEDVLGEVQVDPAILSQKMNPNIVAKAPGMKYRHYAPKGQMTIIEGDTGKVVDEINRLVKEKTDELCSGDRDRGDKGCVCMCQCEECRIARNRGVDSSGIV
jgi:L-threonylcarbamoyladenylate synthase